ncbi:hypothetical protein [Aureimonas leprariae]|uniref:Uncharacterized protein n=1 Tax=Plantimonas leprariae TaxID=2615207 RepID=A0A7V7PPU2_9HYPH|nr:hypothetical protein [Aureimonas leprariae]KAB0679977.1 hypothetical protein F6X38_10415 [Aureimonas leprariae]
MRLHESRIERAERRVREAEANVDRQKQRLAAIEARGDRQAFRSGREVLQSFKDALHAMKLRLKEARRQPV